MAAPRNDTHVAPSRNPETRYAPMHTRRLSAFLTILLAIAALAGCAPGPAATAQPASPQPGPPPGSFVAHMNGQTGGAFFVGH
jgi:hypothetical protein